MKILKDKLGILMLGTGSAQLISLIVVFLLTYLYTPLDFKDYAIFVGLVSILSSVSSLKYEIAIPLGTEQEATSLVYLCLIINFIFLIFINFIIFILFFNKINILNLDFLYLIAISFTVFFVGLYNIFFNWAVRLQKFKLISYTRFKQASIGGLVQIFFGIWGFTKYGLPIGNFFNFTMGLNSLVKLFLSSKREFTYLSTKSVAIFYKSYPKYSSLDALFTQATQHIPTILIGIFYGAKAGLFMLCMRILLAPVGLVGNNLQSIYLSEISHTNSKEELRELTRNIINKSFNFGVLPILALSFVSYFILDKLLSDNWSGVSDMIILCTPWMIFFLITRPLSVFLNYINKQKINFCFNFCLFVCGFLILFFGNTLGFSDPIKYFFFINFLFYSALYYYICFKNLINFNKINFLFVLMVFFFIFLV